jgi:hypothetical protein
MPKPVESDPSHLAPWSPDRSLLAAPSPVDNLMPDWKAAVDRALGRAGGPEELISHTRSEVPTCRRSAL